MTSVSGTGAKHFRFRHSVRISGRFAPAALVISALVACSPTPDPDRVLKGPPDVKVSAPDLQRQYGEDQSAANRRYRGRIIEVNGTVRSVGDDHPLVIFEPGGQGLVQATFHPSVAAGVPKSFQKGQALVLWCEGDGSFSNVLLKNCVVK